MAFKYGSDIVPFGLDNVLYHIVESKHNKNLAMSFNNFIKVEKKIGQIFTVFHQLTLMLLDLHLLHIPV